MPETELVSGFWECDASTGTFTPSSATTLSELCCLRVGAPMCWSEILHEQGRRTTLIALSKAAKSGKPFSLDVQLRTALGTKKWARVIGDNPRPDFLRGFILDYSHLRDEHDDPHLVSVEELESELVASETRYRELFEGVPFPALCYNWETRRILDVNQRAIDEYGYTKEEFLNLPIFRLWPAEECDLVNSVIQSLDPNQPASHNTVHIRKDGTILEVELTSHPIILDKQATRVIVARNTTLSNRAERNLRVSNDRLSFLARMAGAVVGTLSLPDQAAMMAAQVREAFQVDACVVRLARHDSLELLASAGIDTSLLVDRLPIQWGLPSKVIQEGGPISVYDVRESGDLPPIDSPLYSHYAFVSYAAAPLLVKDQIIGVLAIFTELTAREFSEADLSHLQIVANNMAIAVQNSQLYDQVTHQRSTLEASEERLRLVTEASTDGIWEWIRESDTLTWSEKIYDLLDMSRYSFVPQRTRVWEIIHPDDRIEFARAMVKVSRERSALRCEVRLQRGEGSYGHYQVYGKFVFDENNRIAMMVGSIHDVTDRVQRDRELEAVAAISLALREVETTDEMLPMISEQIAQTLGLDSLGLALVVPGTDSVVIRHATGVFENVVGIRFKRHEGLIGRVFADAKVKFAPDLHDEYGKVFRDFLPLSTALLGVPLVARGEVIGVLWLGKTVDSTSANVAFNPNEARLLSILAEIAAASLRRAGLRERTEFHLDRLNSLSVIHSTVSENRDLKTTLDILLRELKAQTGIDAAAVHILQAGETVFLLETSLGLGKGVIAPSLGRDSKIERISAPLSQLLDSGPRGRRLSKLVSAGFHSYLAIPLTTNNHVVGLLEVYHRTDLPDNVDLYHFAEMVASQAAIAVDNTYLLRSLRAANQELTAAYDQTIEGWARALDLRDHETEGHTRRVTAMTVELAKLMGVPDQDIAHMRRGALLHDIGKMAIPDRVLLKPGELDQTEWVIMRRHPGIALDLLDPISFLKPSIDIPFCHHEKWDGSGYPRSLKGTEIPLSARIFAIIDVWDALRSDRPYRKGWSAEQAVHFIEVQSGKHFDPQIVEIFLNHRDQIDRCCR